MEVWRGGVNPWDCDGMGHLNVRFYVSIAMEGLVGLAAELGLQDAFHAAAPSTLQIREHHIRYLREIHPHAPVHMSAGVLEIGETEATILQVLYHSRTGQPAAALQTRVAHVTGREARPFAWSAATRERAEALKVELPDFAMARSIAQTPAGVDVSLARAEAMGLIPIARGAFGPQDCDAFGRMQPHHLIGRISDGIGVMVEPFRATVVEHAEHKPERIGGAALEYRTVHFAWPRAGDRFVILSGVSSVDHRTQRMVHWMFEPGGGKLWAVAEAAVTTFDLDRRKIVPISETAQALIRERIKPGLTT